MSGESGRMWLVVIWAEFMMRMGKKQLKKIQRTQYQSKFKTSKKSDGKNHKKSTGRKVK